MFLYSFLSEISIEERVLLLKTSFKNTDLVQYPHWTEEETEAREERWLVADVAQRHPTVAGREGSSRS